MERRKFVKNFAAASSLGVVASTIGASPFVIRGNNPQAVISPRAITMWDFSWLERRWPGAGYEDW
ncbi:MAG: cellulase, partial [Bacteroidales bacterium]|nr:cellulase [Bacteroidales bacterium]